MKFHALTVASVEWVAEDAVCISLSVPPALRDAFAFHAGQYVTLRCHLDSREQRRTYSIVTAPGRDLLKLGVRLQPNGRVSGHLGRMLRAGERLDVAAPAGRFGTQIDPARSHRYVAFAAGSGITPVLSLIADVLAREPASRVTLIYGNRCTSSTMFLEDLLALKNRHLGRLSLQFVMSREPQKAELLNGRIDRQKIHDMARRIGIGAADEYFICGPGTMIEEVRAAIAEINGVAAVRFERFTTAADATAPADAAVPVPPPLALISILRDGRLRTFPMGPQDSSVLAAAERSGIELPFSCRSGICATCRVRVISGAVVMGHNIALAPWEVDAGFALCCQARPTTQRLELSYDET